MLSLDGIVEFSESARPAIPTHKHAQRIEEVVGVLAMMTAVVIVHGGANVIATSVAIIATKMFASSGGGGGGSLVSRASHRLEPHVMHRAARFITQMSSSTF